ncbi:MAG: penicillin-binding protein [Ignavibacteriaceae bacterium]
MNNSRALIVIVFIFLFFTALVIKLFDIQIVKSEELKYYAQKQQTKVEKIEADRGLIYDRNNTLLVYNRNDVSFYLDMRMVSGSGKIKIAKKFTSVFGKSEKHYLNLMKDSKKTICIERKASSEDALLLKNFKVTGLFYNEDPTRIYQYKKLASHILGYVNNNFRGVNGIENSFDRVLQGDEGKMLVERNAIGDMITVAEEETQPAVPGDNIYLTINKTYQAILEEELKNGLDVYGGISATGIIMNPQNGEILALANLNDYDPETYWKFDDSDRKDKAITDSYEPGSTFKSITMAVLLDRHLCRLNETVNVENGSYKFKNIRISDTHKHQYLSVMGVMEQSSNVGMSKLVQRINDDIYYKYVRAFGFGNYTGIKLPGEVDGELKKPNDWSAVTKAFMSFGYELMVTPLQLISSYCALINGGILYKPLIVKREVDGNGSVIFEDSPGQVRRVISEETSKKMREILYNVVEKGTGVNAKIDNLKVGGKTGTAQRLENGKYSKSDYNSSFIGFFPSDNPKVICLILVNAPKVGRYGGSVAAPIFKNVAERMIKADPELLNTSHEAEMHIASVEKSNYNFPNIVPAKGSSNIQHINEKDFSANNVMPDLTNYSIRDAIYLLTKLGIRYTIRGSGSVLSQSINPGTRFHKDELCVLNCKEASINGTVVY